MAGTSIELDLRALPPDVRHGWVFQAFDALGPGEALVLVNDHDPAPLLQQFKFVRPGQSESQYLERGPTDWRVRIARRAERAAQANPVGAAPAPGEGARTVTEYLEGDHRRLDAMLPEVGRLSRAGSYPGAAGRFATFAESLDRHIEAEEQVLFPVFEGMTGTSTGPTQVMRWEHQQIREWMRRISAALAGEAAVAAADALGGLTEVLTSHNVKEEQMLYPMADSAVGSDAEREALVARLRTFV